MTTTPKLLKVPAAAERLDCHRSHIYKLHAAGELRGTYIGLKRPALRIHEDSVTEFIERNSTQLPRSA